MKYLSGIILAFLLGSCSTPTMQSNKNHIEEKWELVSINGEEVAAEKPFTLSFNEKNQVFGYFGCNRISGGYNITDNSEITLSKLASTKMACDDEAMAYEDKILSALESHTDMRISEDQLIVNANHTNLKFNRIGNTEIVGRYWKLIELNGEKVNFAQHQEKEQSIILRSNNRVNGFTGCNYMNGTYTLGADHQITFDDNMATTMMACQNIDESTYLNAFKNADRYKVSNNKLYLYNGSQGLAVFEAVLF